MYIDLLSHLKCIDALSGNDGPGQLRASPEFFSVRKENDTKEEKKTSRHRFVHLNHLQQVERVSLTLCEKCSPLCKELFCNVSGKQTQTTCQGFDIQLIILRELICSEILLSGNKPIVWTPSGEDICTKYIRVEYLTCATLLCLFTCWRSIFRYDRINWQTSQNSAWCGLLYVRHRF